MGNQNATEEMVLVKGSCKKVLVQSFEDTSLEDQMELLVTQLVDWN